MTSRWIPALALAFAAVAGAQKVTTSFDEDFDFAKIKTFVIRNGRVQSKTAAVSNELAEKKIHKAIAARLTAIGLTEVESKGDVAVSFHLGASNQRERDMAVGPRGRRVIRGSHLVTKGSLTIEMRETAGRELVWRAVCADTVNDPAKLEERLPKDVAKAFEKFPPKKK